MCLKETTNTQADFVLAAPAGFHTAADVEQYVTVDLLCVGVHDGRLLLLC